MPKRHKLSKSSLLWFIKSRPFVLIPELRRRFELDGADDDVAAIQTGEGRSYIGLPERAARMIEDLAREQRVGLEYSVDVGARLIVGIYAYDLLKTPPGSSAHMPRAHHAPIERPPDGDQGDEGEGDEAGAPAGVGGSATQGERRAGGWRGPGRPPQAQGGGEQAHLDVRTSDRGEAGGGPAGAPSDRRGDPRERDQRRFFPRRRFGDRRGGGQGEARGSDRRGGQGAPGPGPRPPR